MLAMFKNISENIGIAAYINIIFVEDGIHISLTITYYTKCGCECKHLGRSRVTAPRRSGGKCKEGHNK